MNAVQRARAQAHQSVYAGAGVQAPAPLTVNSQGNGYGLALDLGDVGRSDVRVGQTALILVAVGIISLAAFSLYTHDFQK